MTERATSARQFAKNPEKRGDFKNVKGCIGNVKKVIVIGNGPSSISLSYMLSGNAPYYVGGVSDEFLDKRLSIEPKQTLLLQNIEQLASGCEGRSSNPVSVFFDQLNHPDADTGRERPSLLEWRKRPDLKVDHLIIGRGRAGGCWDSLDGNVQTVSLGSWMEMPNLKISDLSSSQDDESSRVQVSRVAAYYREYITTMNLAENFLNHSVVTVVREVKDMVCETQTEFAELLLKEKDALMDEENAMFKNETLYDEDMLATISGVPIPKVTQSSVCCCGDSVESASLSATSASASNTASTASSPSSSSSSSDISQLEGLAPLPKTSLLHQRSIANYYSTICIDADECSGRDGRMEDLAASCCSLTEPFVNPELFGSLASSRCGSLVIPQGTPSTRARTSSLSGVITPQQRRCAVSDCFEDTDKLFEVKGYTQCEKSGARKEFSYLTKRVVLATGSQDLPNRVHLPGEDRLPFVLHSLHQLEEKIAASKGALNRDSPPVLVLGAGLSAGDAIITALKEGIPVAHAFRRSAEDPALIFKMLPPAIYPEYHEVYALMRGKAKDDLYTPLPQQELIEILEDERVTLRSSLTGESRMIEVSALVILIGSSPDLSFLESKIRSELAVNRSEPIGRGNPVDIDVFTNEAVDARGVYAMGPLAGDNFVRFLQGGALAIASDIIKKEGPRGA